MTADDLNRIEKALGIRLPESYRSRVAPFPIPAAAGNSNLGVWDDALRLIEINLELRGGAPGGVKPWPSHFFAIGHPGDGSPYALDLQAGDAVWWVDHSHLDNPTSQKEADSFAVWANDYFSTLREEMAGEGVNPDGSPEQRAAFEAKSAREGGIGCIVFIAIVGAAIALLTWFLKS